MKIVYEDWDETDRQANEFCHKKKCRHLPEKWTYADFYQHGNLDWETSTFCPYLGQCIYGTERIENFSRINREREEYFKSLRK